MTVGIRSFTLTITVGKNCIFGKQVLSILTIDIVLHIHALAHLYILMPALFVVGSVIGFNNDYMCHRMWTDTESLQSSTWREFSAKIALEEHF